jgi:hypothetical protein
MWVPMLDVCHIKPKIHSFPVYWIFSSQEPQIIFLCGNALILYLIFDFKILLNFKMLEFRVCVLHVYSRNADRPLQISVRVHERNKERSLKANRMKLIMIGWYKFVDSYSYVYIIWCVGCFGSSASSQLNIFDLCPPRQEHIILFWSGGTHSTIVLMVGHFKGLWLPVGTSSLMWALNHWRGNGIL